MGVSTTDRQQELVAQLLACDGSGIIYPGLRGPILLYNNGCLIPKSRFNAPLHEPGWYLQLTRNMTLKDSRSSGATWPMLKKSASDGNHDCSVQMP